MAKRKQTRRDFLRLTVVGAAGAALVACQGAAPEGAGGTAGEAGGAAGEAVAPPAAGAEPASLLFYWLTGDMSWVERNKPLMAKFVEENPGYSVEQLLPPSGMSAIEKFQAMIAGGEPPDIADTGMDQYSFADRDVFRDLQPLIERDGADLSDEDPIAMQSFYHPGKNIQFGYPHSMNSAVMYFNKDLFDAAGEPYPPQSWDDPSWTWEAYKDVAKRMTQDTDGDGRPDQWGSSAPLYVYNAPFIYGGAWTNEDQTEVLLDRPESIKGFQLYQDAMYTDAYAPTPEAAQLMQSGFMSGRMAMSFGGTWDVAGFRTIQDFGWDTAPCPRDSARPEDAPRGNDVFPDALVMSSVKQVEQSWTLLKWMLLNEENHLYWSWDVLGMFPSRSSLVPEYLRRAQESLPGIAWEVIAESWAHGNLDILFINSNYSEIDSFIGANIWDQLTLASMTAEEAITQALPDLEPLILSGAPK